MRRMSTAKSYKEGKKTKNEGDCRVQKKLRSCLKTSVEPLCGLLVSLSVKRFFEGETPSLRASKTQVDLLQRGAELSPSTVEIYFDRIKGHL